MRPTTPKTQFSTPTKPSSRKSFSFLSTSPQFHKKLASLSKTNSKSPAKSSQLDFRAVLQKNPQLFLREDVGKAFDDAISRVFSAVSKKKCEKEDLDIKQEIFMKEIKNLEKEFPALFLRKKQLSQEIAHECCNIQQLRETIEILRTKILKKQAETREKSSQTQEKLQVLASKVKDLTQENCEIREKISQQRGFMRQKLEDLRTEVQELRVSAKKAEFCEEESRKTFENVKSQDFQRVEKLQNKEKAFFAMIKQ